VKKKEEKKEIMTDVTSQTTFDNFCVEELDYKKTTTLIVKNPS